MNNKGNKMASHNRPPAKQRPQPPDHSTNVSSTSGHVSPSYQDRFQGVAIANPASGYSKQGGAHNQSQAVFDQSQQSSPRHLHGVSTLDEMNRGSPVPTRRHELQPPPHNYHTTGTQSPKLTTQGKHGANGQGERSQQRPQKMQHRELNANNQANASRQHRLAKSYNMDSVSQRVTDREKQPPKEQKTSQGNIIALACGPLKRKRYINPKIELELVDFKKEIEEKFAKSPLKKF